MSDIEKQRKDFAAEFVKQVQIMKRLMERADELAVNATFNLNADRSRRRGKQWVATAEVLTKPEIVSVVSFKE